MMFLDSLRAVAFESSSCSHQFHLWDLFIVSPKVSLRTFYFSFKQTQAYRMVLDAMKFREMCEKEDIAGEWMICKFTILHGHMSPQVSFPSLAS